MMGLPELRAWVQANRADPTDATFRVGGGPTTLGEAIAAGHDGAVHEAITRKRATLQVSRGFISSSEFMAEWTPAMDAQLNNAQHRWLSLNLNNGGVDLGRPAVAATLTPLGFTLTRDGSAAETHLGRDLSLAEVADLLQRNVPVPEQRKVCEADGTISLATFVNGAEIERHPHPNGLAIDPALADPKMGEREINAALRMATAARKTASPIFTPPTPAERDAFVVQWEVKVGQLPDGTWFAATFKGQPDGIEAQAKVADDAVDSLMRVAQREGW